MLYGKRGGSPPWTQLSDKSSPWCPVTTLTAFTFLTQPPAGRKRPSVVLTMFHATLGSLGVSSGAIVGAKEQLHGGLSTIALILSFSTLPFVFTVIFFMSTRWFWNELYLLPQTENYFKVTKLPACHIARDPVTSMESMSQLYRMILGLILGQRLDPVTLEWLGTDWINRQGQTAQAIELRVQQRSWTIPGNKDSLKYGPAFGLQARNKTVMGQNGHLWRPGLRIPLFSSGMLSLTSR